MFTFFAIFRGGMHDAVHAAVDRMAETRPRMFPAQPSEQHIVDLPTSGHACTDARVACAHWLAALRRLTLGGLLGLLLAGALAVVACPRPLDQSRVYSVAQVEARLASHPRAWMHRVLLLRGMAVAVGGHCETNWATVAPVCPAPRAALEDFGPTTSALLPLAWVGPGPLLAVVRRLPLLDELLHAPQAVAWGEVATYRVQVQAIPQSIRGTGVCYEAVLLDAAP